MWFTLAATMPQVNQKWLDDVGRCAYAHTVLHAYVRSYLTLARFIQRLVAEKCRLPVNVPGSLDEQEV